jgi:hypothetical protein
MIMNPAIIALVSGSLLVTAFACYALYTALLILKHWNIRSGSEGQLLLERKTYLISTVFSYVLAFELLSLVLFIYTAEHIHNLFIGAMCAAGSLNANDYGYVALVVKVLTFVLCGVWILVNYTDNQADDYPLIRPKYRFLILLTCLIGLDTFLQVKYFMGLKADVITSCCGIIFNGQSQGLAGSMSALPPAATRIIFYLVLILTMRVGIGVVVTGRGAAWYGLLAGVATVVSLVAVISFISVYYYELPTHHCPFCLLQKDYHYIGFPLYLSLLAAGTSGVATGVIEKLKGPASLAAVIPAVQKRLCLFSLGGFLIFTAIASYPLLFSDFVLYS